MAVPRKYPEELRERAIRLAVEARWDPVSRPGACRRIGEQLGINPETLRGWVMQAEVDAGHRAGTTSTDAQRLAELERENRELRRTNAILLAASVFFASMSSWWTSVGLVRFFAAPSGGFSAMCHPVDTGDLAAGQGQDEDRPIMSSAARAPNTSECPMLVPVK